MVGVSAVTDVGAETKLSAEEEHCKRNETRFATASTET